jgi:exopolyphosphatase / guanosine-5'-triphosphate,3'-diphosphate pyrophosphatase
MRLLIADLPADGGQLTDVARKMEIVRLGAGVDRTRRISSDALDRASTTLTTFARDIAESGAERVRMVATSASRDAENADEFRRMVVSALGVEPEVITGQQEACLSFSGAVRDLPPLFYDPCLVIDIGGGSTEFVVGSRNRSDDPVGSGVAIDAAISIDMGCVRITERHLPDDPPKTEQIAAAQMEIIDAVDRALAAIPAQTARTLVGLAGSVTTVAGVALDLGHYDPARIHHARIPYPVIAKLTSNLLSATRSERSAIPVMHPGRAGVIGAGALILRTIMERTGFAEVVASERDILDGIAWSMA